MIQRKPFIRIACLGALIVGQTAFGDAVFHLYFNNYFIDSSGLPTSETLDALGHPASEHEEEESTPNPGLVPTPWPILSVERASRCAKFTKLVLRPLWELVHHDGPAIEAADRLVDAVCEEHGFTQLAIVASCVRSHAPPTLS